MPQFSNNGITIQLGDIMTPAPSGDVENSRDVIVTVLVEPAHQSNTVNIIYRKNKGTETILRATKQALRSNQQKDYFDAKFPKLTPGDVIEYSPVCQCAGKLNDPRVKGRHVANFRIINSKQRATSTLSSPSISTIQPKIDQPTQFRSRPPRSSVTDSIEPGDLKQFRNEILQIENEIQHTLAVVYHLEEKLENKSSIAHDSIAHNKSSHYTADNVEEQLAAERKQLKLLNKQKKAHIATVDRIRLKNFRRWNVPDRYPVLMLPVRIETVFNDHELRVRLYPDQLAIDTHEPDLMMEEIKAGREYRKALESNSAEEVQNENTAKQDAWRKFASQHGPQRAAWIIHSLDNYDHVTDLSNLEQVVGLKQDAWTRAPVTRVMPDYFTVKLYRMGEVVYTQNGKLIPDQLAILWDPNTDDSNEGLFDKDSLWMQDFDEARNKGMAVIFENLKQQDLDKGFDKVVAVGISASLDHQDSALQLESLFKAHRYTSGIGFLKYGTPTNNTINDKSGHSEEFRDLEGSYLSECAPENNDCNLLIQTANWLGIDPNVFHGLEHHDIQRSYNFDHAENMQQALWPTTMGLLISALLRPTRDADGLWKNSEHWNSALRLHFTKYVRARGHLPAIRLDNQPYGILPVTKIRNYVPSKFDSLASHKKESIEAKNSDKVIVAVLKKFYGHWQQISANPEAVPRINSSNDQDAEYLKMLAMHPASTEIYNRALDDEKLAIVLNRVMGKHSFLSELGISGLGNLNWIQLWEEQLNSGKIKAQEFLNDIYSLAGIEPKSEHTNNWLMNSMSLAGASLLNMPLVSQKNDVNDGAIPDYLKDLVNSNQSKPNTLLHHLLKQALKFEAETGQGAEDQVKDAIKRLNANDQQHELKAPDLETLLTDTLELCTHRLDAWFTSFASKRLQSMLIKNQRDDERAGNNESASNGVYLGAYGYVENLKPKSATEAIHSGGYIHAPGINQAQAGAFVRSTYLNYMGNELSNLARTSLNSNRVRWAKRILQGLNDKLSIPMLYGIQFELGLHERGLDQFIDEFRKQYTLDAEKPENTDENGERLDPRSLVNGEKIINKYQQFDADTDDFAQQIIADIGLDEPSYITSLQAEILSLLETADAIGDVLTFEGYYQIMQGNAARAGASFDTQAGQGVNRELESMQTHVGGIDTSYRLVTVFPDSISANPHPRLQAEPRFASWLEKLIDDTKTGCTVHYQIVDGNGESTIARELSLHELGIHPVDLFYMAQTPPAGEETELEQRIACWIFANLEGQTLTVAANIRIEFNVTQHTTIADALELASSLGKMLENTSYLKPATFTNPMNDEQSSSFGVETIVDLLVRINNATQILSDESGSNIGIKQKLDNSVVLTETEEQAEQVQLSQQQRQGIEQALVEARDFGITSATYTPPIDDSTLNRRAHTVNKEITRRLLESSTSINNALKKLLVSNPEENVTQENLDQLHNELLNDSTSEINQTNLSEAVKALLKAMKALFGRAFIVLPTFRVNNHEELNASLNSQPLLLAGQNHTRVMTWLQQVALPGENPLKYENGIMALDAWNNRKDDVINYVELKVMQLPYDPTVKWMALSDQEWREAEETSEPNTEQTPIERPSGTVSIIAMMADESALVGGLVAGIVHDEFSDHIPNDTVDTGISFHYNQPNQQAPQSMLLAVPGQWKDKPGQWTHDDLFEIVLDNMDLAKARLVDLDAYAHTQDISRFLPAAYLFKQPDETWIKTERAIAHLSSLEHIRP